MSFGTKTMDKVAGELGIKDGRYTKSELSSMGEDSVHV